MVYFSLPSSIEITSLTGNKQKLNSKSLKYVLVSLVCSPKTETFFFRFSIPPYQSRRERVVGPDLHPRRVPHHHPPPRDGGEAVGDGPGPGPQGLPVRGDLNSVDLNINVLFFYKKTKTKNILSFRPNKQVCVLGEGQEDLFCEKYIFDLIFFLLKQYNAFVGDIDNVRIAREGDPSTHQSSRVPERGDGPRRLPERGGAAEHSGKNKMDN